MLLLEHFNIDTKGKHAVVVGRSNIVGRPMSILLGSNLNKGNCSVTICHSHTPNIEAFCKEADILVAALGKPGFITANMVKPGAVIIDVGITRVADETTKSGFRIKGDVAYNEVSAVASAITPVPGGVGLMTIAGLLKNTMQAYLQHA
jgi:methylenetetrahydrofolate dehydrogenase (NADP+)/methenyltetrahydrofolate cyclohydrolase